MPQPVTFATAALVPVGPRRGAHRAGARRALTATTSGGPAQPTGPQVVSLRCQAGECQHCRGRVLNPDVAGPQFVACACTRPGCTHGTPKRRRTRR